jgi:hypothetical protein
MVSFFILLLVLRGDGLIVKGLGNSFKSARATRLKPLVIATFIKCYPLEAVA